MRGPRVVMARSSMKISRAFVSCARNEAFLVQQKADHDSAKWGAGALEYEQAFSGKFESYAGIALQMLQDLSDHRVGSLLDVGCGSGAVAAALVKGDHLPVLQKLTCVDFSEQMVDLTRQNVDSLNRNGDMDAQDVQVEVMDGMALNFVDNNFDAAIGMFSLIFFPQPSKGLEEMLRVLRPGGATLVGAWGPAKTLEWVHFSNKAIMTTLADPNNRWGVTLPPPPSDRSLRQNFLCWADAEYFKGQICSAGFDEATAVVRPVTQRFSLADHAIAEKMWSDMAVSFPTLGYLFESECMAHLPPEVVEQELKPELARNFAKLIHQERGNDQEFGYLDGTAMFGFGRKPSDGA